MIELFKIDSKDKIRVLCIEAIDGVLHKNAGIYKGKLVAHSKECKRKNRGRANETSATQQAELEAEAEVKKKLREGYVLVPDSVKEKGLKSYILLNSSSVPDVMLANKVKDRKTPIDWSKGVLVSAKLDGMRATAPFDPDAVLPPLYSRGRKKIETMAHIQKLIADFRKVTGFIGTLDGELYYHDKAADNFQEIMKACKKYRKGTSELVDYYIYELVNTQIDALDRYEELNRHISKFNASLTAGTNIQLHCVTQHLVFSKEEADTIHEKYIAEGYEGTMWKPTSCMYKEGARSMDLLKRKDFDEGEFLVTNIVPMDAYPLQGKVHLYCEKTKEHFYATPSMSHARRVKLLSNKNEWIGGMATVKYFGLTDKGVPRIATLKWITKENDEHERYRFGTKESTRVLD